ncbi:hypothetical protein KIL84_004632 [Mauremys mutica]|uniref:Uncharacterized protein n=1 Tax=Mauremys mutica TaxID=74926 RepID=A0A9D3XQ25_9SAUR|nr:hypothetical protein KIL84_004632 [Mauremys mutica]
MLILWADLRILSPTSFPFSRTAPLTCALICIFLSLSLHCHSPAGFNILLRTNGSLLLLGNKPEVKGNSGFSHSGEKHQTPAQQQTPTQATGLLPSVPMRSLKKKLLIVKGTSVVVHQKI